MLRSVATHKKTGVLGVVVVVVAIGIAAYQGGVRSGFFPRVGVEAEVREGARRGDGSGTRGERTDVEGTGVSGGGGGASDVVAGEAGQGGGVGGGERARSDGREEAGEGKGEAEERNIKGGDTGVGVGVGVGGRVRMGSFNIEWLGKSGERSGQGRNVAQSAEDLADVVIESGVDVLAVQEITTALEGMPPRSRELEAVLGELNIRTKGKSGAGFKGEADGNAAGTWDYVLFPGRRGGDQLTGVVWNTGKLTAVKADGSAWDARSDLPWAVPVAKGRSAQGSGWWNRPPHAMKFSCGAGRSDFVLIVLHMKADYQGDFATHRAEEARGLVGALAGVATKFKDEDIVLLGDLNCLDEGEGALSAFAAAGYRDLNGGKHQTHWRGGATDRIFTRRGQKEFEGCVQGVMSGVYLRKRNLSPADYKRRYSDHYLVYTDVAVKVDDD